MIWFVWVYRDHFSVCIKKIKQNFSLYAFMAFLNLRVIFISSLCSKHMLSDSKGCGTGQYFSTNSHLCLSTSIFQVKLIKFSYVIFSLQNFFHFLFEGSKLDMPNLLRVLGKISRRIIFSYVLWLFHRNHIMCVIQYILIYIFGLHYLVLNPSNHCHRFTEMQHI